MSTAVLTAPATVVAPPAARRVSLVKLTPEQLAARRQHDALYAEYQAYRAHSGGCDECAQRLHNCPAGAALWRAYTDARGPLVTPIPGGRP